jgi:hypothetical protein
MAAPAASFSTSQPRRERPSHGYEQLIEVLKDEGARRDEEKVEVHFEKQGMSMPTPSTDNNR